MMMDEELAALADGTLAPERRDAVARRVDADPELAAAVARQRAALAAIGDTAREPASDALRASVSAMASRASAPRRRARVPRQLAFAGTFATVAVIVALAIVGDGPPGPTVAEAARVALAPAVQQGEAARGASVDGVSFPYWSDGTGWRPVGGRRDVLRGRTIHTVFYASANHRIGYAIAAGAPLQAEGGRIVTRNGVRMRVLRDRDATIVTWMRDGHSCLLVARHVDPDVLLALASRPT